MPMASIASPLLQRRKDPDEEQLLKLFWNRAELKKELAQLRRDRERLMDQLRQQESTNLRSQQRLEQLENLLVDPLQASNALVYYQLRGVWQQCHKRLARVARELTERQQQREDQHARELFRRRQDGELAALDARIADLDQRMQAALGDHEALVKRSQELSGFWNYFRRRAVNERAAAARAALDGVHSQLERLQATRREQETEPAPTLAGIGGAGQRNINLAIIAMAQQLLVSFAEHNVAGLAREAALRDLADVSYGSIAECQVLGRTVDAVVRKLDTPERLNALVRRRAEFLNRTAQYRRDSDKVPIADSFAVVPLAITDTGEPRPADDRVIPVNVLADEYWDIYSVLLG